MIRRMQPSERDAVANLFSGAPEAARWSPLDLWQLETSGAEIRIDIEQSHLAGAVAWREAAGEAEILNLAVESGWRRKGIGRGLMETALLQLASNGVGGVFLEVRESNTGARAFYAQMGFAEQGRRRNYYREPTEDALLLSRAL